MKKRHMLTLTDSRVKEFQALAKELGMPPSTLSYAVDDFIRDLTATLVSCKEKGNLTLSDVLRVAADQIEKGSSYDEKRKEKTSAGKTRR